MKILLADDFGILRQGLTALINGQPDMQVVAEARDGRQAVTLAKEKRPDIIIMDVTMPRMNGIEATKLIKKELPSTKIVALSMHPDRHFVIEILRAGAKAYVLKLYLFDELVRAIRTVMKGDYYLSPQITDVVVADITKQTGSAEAGAHSILTERQLQILRRVADGKSAKEIAFELNISPKTADAGRRDIMKKLGIDSVAELTKYAVREGLTTL